MLSRIARRPQYGMRFRRMTKEDIPAVAALEQACFSQPWSARALEAELENPRAVFFVARSGDRTAGYMGMHFVLDEGYIANVAVDERFRRRGVATALVNRMRAFAKRRELSFMTLEVRDSNEAAIALYRGLGFGEVGRRKRFYANPTEDAVLMTVYLTPKTKN